jgi:hypothetical protein
MESDIHSYALHLVSHKASRCHVVAMMRLRNEWGASAHNAESTRIFAPPASAAQEGHTQAHSQEWDERSGLDIRVVVAAAVAVAIAFVNVGR